MKLSSSIRYSTVSLSPLSLTTKLPSRFQPAAASSFDACDSSLRSRPEPSEAGCVTASPKASGGSSAAERFEQRQFLRRRQPLGLVVGAFETGVRALVGAVEEVAPGPFEVEAQRDRPPHARVAEALAALVDRRRLHRRPLLAGKLALDHLAGGDRRKIIAGRPGARDEFLPVENVALLERLECGLPVAVEFDADAVEIVLAAVHRQVAAPIVGDALIFDRLARGDAPDVVRSRAERRVDLRAVERVGLVECLRDDRVFEDGQDGAGRLLAVEGQAERRRVFGHGLRHVGQRKRKVGMALVLVGDEREGDVGGRQRRAVVPARLGPQLEDEGVAIVGQADRLGQQAVERIGLVERGSPSGCRSTSPCAAAHRRRAPGSSAC